MILSIDPGNEKSAFVIWDGAEIIESGIFPNEEMLVFLSNLYVGIDAVVIEMIGHYGTGMPAGASVFDTCVWIGRFMQIVCEQKQQVYLVKRHEVKMHLCRSMRAKDSNIRQALIDRLGAPGTKKAKGLTYGLKADEWQALGLAVTWWDTHK